MSSSSRNYHHGNLRAELVSAALDMLDTQTAASLSLRQVAQQAGVSHNAPYYHFADRTAMLEAVGVEAMRRFVAAQRDAIERATGPRDALLEMGAAYVGWAADHPGAFAVIYDPEICDPREPSDAMAPLIRENEALLHAATRAAASAAAGPAAGAASPAQEGEVRMEPIEIALWGMVHGLAVLHVAGHFPAEAIRPALEASLSRLGV